MDGNYLIPSLLRWVIKELNCPWQSEEMRQFVILDFKERLNEAAKDLSLEEKQNLHTYMESLIGHIENAKEVLTTMKVDISDDSKRELTDEEKFIRHVLCDQQEKIGSFMEMLKVALKVVKMGKEEVEKLLPTQPNVGEGEKALQKVNKEGKNN